MSGSKENSEKDIDNMSPEELAELQIKNCIFCKIANKEIPSKIVYEDKEIICILDINPSSEGHILVYPKKHYMIMPHLPEELLSKIFLTVRFISNSLLKALQCGGTTIFVANGSAAGQKAPHVLVHVFPRRENDGLIKLPQYEMNDEQIEKLKKELSKYFNHVFGAADEQVEIKEKNIEHHKTEHTEKILLKKEEKKTKNTSIHTSDKHKPKKENISLDDIGKLFE